MPLSNFTQARDAIMSHFKTAWDAQTPPVPIVIYEDREQARPANSAYAEVRIRYFGPHRQATLGETGGRRFRRFGVVVVDILTPRGEGLTRSDQYSTVAVDAFEGQKTAADGVWFRNVTKTEEEVVGEFYKSKVFAEFEWDVVK